MIIDLKSTKFINKITALIRKWWANKIFRITIISVILIYAFIGFFLTSAYLAVKWHLTDDPGAIDVNDRYYQKVYEKHKVDDTSSLKYNEAELFYKLSILHQYYPRNARLLTETFSLTHNPNLVEKMLDVIDVYMKDSTGYNSQIAEISQIPQKNDNDDSLSVYYWMNMFEWEDFKIALAKDENIIKRVSQETGVSARLIASMIVGEQIRLFDSKREAYKKWIGPLKILSVESQFSWGVTGIKPGTAQLMEHYLKDSTSIFYLGCKYKHLLDFKTSQPDTERFYRLTDFRNHYFSYLYAAIFLKQIHKQWLKAGYDISDRPEILATLFNLGYEVSKPKPDPRVGGSNILIKGRLYTFGVLAYEFYYSGELADEFPYTKQVFRD
jgi:hypothetical protein